MEELLPQIPRIHTAFAEWAACMVFVLVFHKKMHQWKLPVISAVTLMIQCVYQTLIGSFSLEFWIVGMAGAVLLMFFNILLTTKMAVKDVAFCLVRAFVLAEFAASLEWQIYCFAIYPLDSPIDRYLRIGIMIFVYAIVFYSAYRIEKRFTSDDKKLYIKTKELIMSASIGIAAFIVSNISFVYTHTPFSARYDAEIYLVRTLVNFGGLAVLYAYYILSAQLREEQELNAIKNVLQRQYDQYKLSKENTMLLNMKYHDLKHQISAIRAEENDEKREEYLQEMEQQLKIYDSKINTGNKVLDMILTGKSLQCVVDDIEFTCVAQGELLEFMNAVDISTIFGNALDNAIECEKKIPDKEKRLIHVAVFAKADFIMIKCENYFEGRLENMTKGLPATTKEDTGFHGYGLKSINYSVGKYGGKLNIGINNNWFELKVLIPRKIMD